MQPSAIAQTHSALSVCLAAASECPHHRAPGLLSAVGTVNTARRYLYISYQGFLEHRTLHYQSDQSQVARLPFLSYNQQFAMDPSFFKRVLTALPVTSCQGKML